MNMTDFEICKTYRESKKKNAQIEILAQLNCCGKDDIKFILLTNGEAVSGVKSDMLIRRLNAAGFDRNGLKLKEHKNIKVEKYHKLDKYDAHEEDEASVTVNASDEDVKEDVREVEETVMMAAETDISGVRADLDNDTALWFRTANNHLTSNSGDTTEGSGKTDLPNMAAGSDTAAGDLWDIPEDTKGMIADIILEKIYAIDCEIKQLMLTMEKVAQDIESHEQSKKKLSDFLSHCTGGKYGAEESRKVRSL